MSPSPLNTTADGAVTWPWLTSPAGLAEPARQAGFPRIAIRTPGGDLTAVRAARSFTRATLQRWEMTDRCDDIALVVSELLTNALEHAAPRPGGWPVRIGLLQSRPGAAVLCAVADASLAPPVPAPPGDLAESGRGLHVIEEISDSWGYTTAPHRGKVVWATFAPSAVPSSAVPPAVLPAAPSSAVLPAVLPAAPSSAVLPAAASAGGLDPARPGAGEPAGRRVPAGDVHARAAAPRR